MRWIQILLVVIVLELGVIALKLPTPHAAASGTVDVRIVDVAYDAFTHAEPIHVRVER
jgi:hypothetical protein